jgi:hypothetical protein
MIVRNVSPKVPPNPNPVAISSPAALIAHPISHLTLLRWSIRVSSVRRKVHQRRRLASYSLSARSAIRTSTPVDTPTLPIPKARIEEHTASRFFLRCVKRSPSCSEVTPIRHKIFDCAAKKTLSPQIIASSFSKFGPTCYCPYRRL